MTELRRPRCRSLPWASSFGTWHPATIRGTGLTGIKLREIQERKYGIEVASTGNR